MSRNLTKPEREALKAVWRLSRAPAADGTARTGDLADSLRVSPGTATATVKRLAERGILVHTPYHGVALSPEGGRLAMAVIRRHRIVERFLADMLGYTWAEADALAPTFEHELPQEVEDRLFVVLDRPTTCPHGFPIPGDEWDSLPTLPVLYDLAPGERAVVALPGSTAPELASFLEGLGVRPGVEIVLREKQPFDGPVVVSVDGHERTLGSSVANQIFVRHTPAAGGSAAKAATAGGANDRGRLPRARREKQSR